MSFRTQVALLVAALVAVAAVVGGVTARVSAEQELVEEIDEFLVGRIEVFERAALDRRGQIFRPGVGEFIGGRPRPRLGDTDLAAEDSVVQIVDATGEVVISQQGAPLLPVRTDADQQIETVSVDGTELRLISQSFEQGLTVQVARDLTETNTALDGLTRRLLVGGLVVTLLAALLGWLLARRLTRPIVRLTAATEDVARTKEFDRPVDAGGQGEVGRLADSFNSMLDELGSSRAQQRRLVEDAGHELRTPLTSLRTNIELLQNPALSDDDRDRVLARLRTETSELSTLVDEVVDLGTDSRASEPSGPCDLVEISDAVAQRARRRRDRTVLLTGVETAPVIGQPQMLDRAVTNLVDNAIKFDEHGTISVEVGVDGVEVRDGGPGIPDDELDEVFDRFHRASTSRDVSGSGLGLSIVRQIAEAHGGSVYAYNRPDGGAAVGFRIDPASPA